jgi:hypothetical protein
MFALNDDPNDTPILEGDPLRGPLGPPDGSKSSFSPEKKRD